MNPKESAVHIYCADVASFTRLRAIELEGDQSFLALGIGPFSSDESEDRLADAAVVFAADTPPIGFVSLEVVDGAAHLVQLSVLPTARRRGIGSALTRRAIAWAREEGFTAMTLTTYRDVAWNAPFYESFGFRAVTELTPQLTKIRQHEIDMGDDAFGPRVAMRLSLER